jgi:cystathionine beta-lyase/cystathionine gamma-synthase
MQGEVVDGAQHARCVSLQDSTSAAQRQSLPDRGIGTRILHPAKHPVHDPYAAVSPPLYQTATFGQPGATEGGPYDYTRSGNPTRTQLESQMAELEVRAWRCAGIGSHRACQAP